MLGTSDALQVDNNDLSKLRPMGVGDILDGTFSLYRRHFSLFIGIASIYFIANIVEYSLKGLLSKSELNSIIAAIVSMPLILLSMGGIVVAATRIYLGGESTSFAALRQTLPRLWTLIYCRLIWLLAMVGPIILIFLSLGSVRGTGPLALPIMIAVICVPIMIYISVRWVFYIETVMIEDYSGISALRRSSELVQENWWKVCVIVFMIILSSYAVRYILEISLGIVLVVANLAGGADFRSIIEWSILDKVLDTGSYPFYVVMTSSQMVLKALVLPVWIIGVVLLYFDRRVRKEGYDIEITANRPDILV